MTEQQREAFTFWARTVLDMAERKSLPDDHRLIAWPAGVGLTVGAVRATLAALSHAEGEAPPVALEALAFVAQAGDAVSSLHLTKFEECISTIRAALSRPEGQAVGVVEPADHQALAAWLGDKPRRMAVAETSPASIQSLPEGTKLYTHPAPAGELRPDCSVCGDFGSDCDVCGGPSQQPVSDPDGLAAAERPGALMEAAGLLKIARSKMGADDDECESDEEATRWRRMAAAEKELRELVKHSAPAPDEREIAAKALEDFASRKETSRASWFSFELRQEAARLRELGGSHD